MSQGAFTWSGSLFLVSLNSSSHVATYNVRGSVWINNSAYDQNLYGWFRYTTNQTTASNLYHLTAPTDEVFFTSNIDFAADANVEYRADGSYQGSTHYFKSVAVAPSANTPSSSSVTSSTATISCDYYPNTNESTATIYLEYKRVVDSTWTTAGTQDTSQTGYAIHSISRNLTGLTSSTQYQYRLQMTRTTTTNTTLTSSTGTFTTSAGVPTITTDSASGVAANSATLNSTLTINEGTGVNVYFKWGTDNPPTQNTTADQPASASGSFQQAISSLSASTTYYAQAFSSFSTPAGSPSSGSVVSFTTPADPALEAAQEDHVHIYDYDGTYGAATDIYFTLSSPAATSSDRLVTTDPGTLFAAGDIKISKDGGAFANVANSVSQVAASNPLYKLTLSATEMQAELAIVQIVDQNGPAFRDQLWIVRTKQRLGAVIVDSSNITNGSAVTYTGNGTGHGLSCVGGATGYDINGVLGQHVLRAGLAQAGAAGTITLDASASATDDIYNECAILLVSGTGAGQFRIISDYNGTTKVASVNRSWAVNPAASSKFLIVEASDAWNVTLSELTAIPSAADTMGKKLQGLFQRFFFRRKQTATTQTLYKADSSTTLGTATVTASGTEQEIGKAS